MQQLTIPYGWFSNLEYGQKAGRRVAAAIGTTILLGPLGLLMRFSHKRKHYLTIGYKDPEGKDQVAVLELGKDIVRTTLAVAETKSGKPITYQDDEAQVGQRGKQMTEVLTNRAPVVQRRLHRVLVAGLIVCAGSLSACGGGSSPTSPSSPSYPACSSARVCGAH